jgi:hypothetical protein
VAVLDLDLDLPSSSPAFFFAAAWWLWAGWPVKLLPRLAGLMSAGDRWQSWLLLD